MLIHFIIPSWLQYPQSQPAAAEEEEGLDPFYLLVDVGLALHQMHQLGMAHGRVNVSCSGFQSPRY